MSFFENTRQPSGLGGNVMISMMNLGHRALTNWGLQALHLAPDARVLDCGCVVWQGHVEEMIFADAWFDAVTAFETVYFWPGLPRCFREIRRVLKPGGTFLICNECSGDTDRDDKWTDKISGMTIYRDVQLKAALEQAGFGAIQVYKNKKGWLCITARK